MAQQQNPVRPATMQRLAANVGGTVSQVAQSQEE
jgi:hypothetical protein